MIEILLRDVCEGENIYDKNLFLGKPVQIVF